MSLTVLPASQLPLCVFATLAQCVNNPLIPKRGGNKVHLLVFFFFFSSWIGERHKAAEEFHTLLVSEASKRRPLARLVLTAVVQMDTDGSSRPLIFLLLLFLVSSTCACVLQKLKPAGCPLLALSLSRTCLTARSLCNNPAYPRCSSCFFLSYHHQSTHILIVVGGSACCCTGASLPAIVERLFSDSRIWLLRLWGCPHRDHRLTQRRTSTHPVDTHTLHQPSVARDTSSSIPNSSAVGQP